MYYYMIYYLQCVIYLYYIIHLVYIPSWANKRGVGAEDLGGKFTGRWKEHMYTFSCHVDKIFLV